MYSSVDRGFFGSGNVPLSQSVQPLNNPGADARSLLDSLL